MRTPEPSTPARCRISTLFAEASLVRVFQSLENGEDLRTMQEELCFLRLPALPPVKDLHFDLLNIPEKSEQAFLRVRPDIDRAAWDLGRQAFQNEQKYGAATWYKWRIRNWGTKWNAYGYEDGVQFDGHSLRFWSAWSPPQPVIAKLSEMYPDLDFVHQFADEDIGHNCGEDEYHNGSLCGEYRPAGVEAVEYANSLWGNGELEEDEDLDSVISMK